MPSLPAADLASSVPESVERSGDVRARVAAARERQRSRQQSCNARLPPALVMRHCVPDAAGGTLLARAANKLALSARSYHRVLKVARTIADLAAEPGIEARHVAEALAYRRTETATG